MNSDLKKMEMTLNLKNKMINKLQNLRKNKQDNLN